MKGLAKPGFLVSAILVVTLAFTGCYWTPNEEEGAITLEIDAEGIGASQLENYDGFFFGWVVADDLMQGGTAEADRAFSEVDTAIEEAFLEIEMSGDLSDFTIDVALPSIQLQASFFSGSSGTNTFRGLRADREYLVVVEAYNYSTETDGVGFTTVEIKAGDTKTVDLDVGNNWKAFYDFLFNQYGIPPDGLEIAVLPVYTDGFTQLPNVLYYDFIDVDSLGNPLFMTDYLDSDGTYTYVNSSFGLETDLNNAPLVDKTGASVPSSSGDRPQLPQEQVIEGVLPGMRVQIIVTDNDNRSYNSPGTPPYGIGIIGISDPFTVGSTSQPVVLYEFRQLFC